MLGSSDGNVVGDRGDGVGVAGSAVGGGTGGGSGVGGSMDGCNDASERATGSPHRHLVAEYPL